MDIKLSLQFSCSFLCETNPTVERTKEVGHDFKYYRYLKRSFLFIDPFKEPVGKD